MDNHCTKNKYNKNITENAKEDITTVKKREDKGKKADAYAQIMTAKKISSH